MEARAIAESCMPLSNSKASFTQSGLPPLENGDRLTQVEFERRYHAMPHVKKAELIEGVVYMASPIDESCGGQSFIGAEGYVEGAPELTAEVAASNKQMPQVLTTLQAGLNAEPHQVFLQGLGRG